jgi:hypothetical protein
LQHDRLERARGRGLAVCPNQDKKLDRSNTRGFVLGVLCPSPAGPRNSSLLGNQKKMQTPAASLSPSKADPPAGKDDIKLNRPIFGSLAKIVAEEFAKHTLTTLQAGLNNMPASDSFEPMHQYVESRYLEAVDVFEICIHRCVFNPHFIQDVQQRERVAEIYHTAIDAQTIREAIIRQRQQEEEEEEEHQRVKDAEDNIGKQEDSLPEVQPTEDDLDKLKEKIKQLSLHKDELEKQRTRLQSRTKTIESCETLLQDMEKTTESTTDSANVERVQSMLLQAQTANRLGDKAEEYQKNIEENRKRKGNGNGLVVVPKQQQRKKRASFGTRYNNSVAKVDPNALLAIMGKIFDDKK